MKPPLRTKSVGTKVSEAEFAMLEERARASGLTLSEWVRDVLLAGPAEPGAELVSEVVLAELLALRCKRPVLAGCTWCCSAVIIYGWLMLK